MLKIDNLNKSYGKKVALKNLSLEVNDGEIFGFIGPNGAGKTTTIKCILSLINKDSGDIYINDTLVDKDYYKLNEDIGYLPSEVNLYDNMFVSEIIEYSKSFYKKDISERTEYLIRQFELDTSKKVRELSFGNLKKLGIVIALMHSPKFLILDEPTSGLDPLMQEIFFNTLKDEKERGTTIFFSSHNLSEVKRICDRVGIIKDGSIVAIEEMATLANNNFVTVTITGKNSKRIKLPVKDMYIKKVDKNSIKFMYYGNINELVRVISEVEIDGLSIEEPTLEDIFMHYYKGE